MRDAPPPTEIAGGHRLPIDLGRGREAFVVSAGHADIFAIRLREDGREDRKHHLFRVERDEALIAFPSLPGDGVRLVAIGALDAWFRPAGIEDLPPAAIRSWTERMDRAAWRPGVEPPPAGLEETHRRTLRAIAERLALEARRDQDLLERRIQRSHSLVDRSLSVLASVAAARPSASPPTGLGGPIAALLPLARHLGLGEILSLHRQTGAAAPDDIDGIERQLTSLRLRRRRVQLRPGWTGRSDEPLAGWLDGGGEPVSLLPGRSWRVATDQGEAPLTATLRDRIKGTGLQLYRRLPDRKAGFGDLLALAWTAGRADLARVLLGGAGAALIGFFLPVATALLFDEVVPDGERGDLVPTLLGLVAAAVGNAIFQAWRGIALVRLETRVEGITQSALFDRLLGLPARFFRRFSVGDLTDRLLGIQEARRILGDNALSGLLSLFFSLASLGIMAFFSRRLALVALGLVALTALIDAGLSYGQLRHERLRMRSQGELDGFLLQLIVGIGKLKVAAAESRAAAQWAARFARQRNHYRAARGWAAWRETIQTLVPGITQIVLYLSVMTALRGGQTGDAPGIATGSFIAFTTAFGQLTAAFGTAVRALAAAISAIPLIERARPILEAEPEHPAQAEAPDDLTGRIDLRQVSFRYGPDLPPVLDGLNLSIEAGQSVALVGESGCGKSTLLRLLLGFERPDQGEIYFDDRPAGRLDPVALNRLFGVVLQNGRLSSGSIFENIVGQAPIDMSQAWEAAALAGLDQDIRDMPMGMHTMLTDGAVVLSGGQRQRLLIARALVHRPRFLFFDEATSALDNRTQAVVTDTLARLKVTRIVIAHRLTTIRSVDRIFVLERGRVAQSGHYEELMARDGPFAQLARRQLI